ncbi:flagellar export protein FliJ [Treponema sp.]|uniref:flagellar export protein FliJ n=1 Tax=Treponema sp. TaxID=166 RepID=UPI003FA32F8A
MQRFHFRLQKLLDLRTFREKEAETNLGHAIAARESIVLRLTEIGKAEVRTRQSLKVSAKTSEDFSIHGNYLERLHGEREQQLKALAEAELVIEKMRALYIKAHQERLIVTKLRERKEVEWRTDWLKQQDVMLDDMINAQEHRKMEELRRKAL